MEYKGYKSVAYYLSAWQGNLKYSEIDLLEKLTQSYLPRKKRFDDLIAVNIGAGAGTSTITMLESRPDIVVFSVDIETTGNEAITNEHLRLAEVGMDKDGRVIRIWGNSAYVGLRFPIHPDILFVDGDHRYHELILDIKGWYDKVVMDGFIFFHDYTRDIWPDVQQAVDRLSATGCMIEVGKSETLICFKKISEYDFSGW